MPFWNMCTAMTSSVPVVHACASMELGQQFWRSLELCLVMSGVTLDHSAGRLWPFNYFEGC